MSRKRTAEKRKQRPAEAASDTEKVRPAAPWPKRVLRHRAVPWVLFTLALAAAITFAVLWLSDKGTDEATAEVRDTSRQFLATLTNFSARTIEEDVEQIRAFGVGRFAEEVEETFSPARIAAIRENEVVSTGRVESVFVQTLEGSTATVFGVVNETIVNAAAPAPRVEVLRVEVELIETPDGWKVSSVEILQSPASVPFTP